MAKAPTKGARAPVNKDLASTAPSVALQEVSTTVDPDGQANLMTGDLSNALQQVQDGEHLQLDGEGSQELQGGVPTSATPHLLDVLVITSIPASFCRAGRRFTHEETVIALADFSEEEVAQLRGEPMLRVRDGQIDMADIDLADTLAEHLEERA